MIITNFFGVVLCVIVCISFSFAEEALPLFLNGAPVSSYPRLRDISFFENLSGHKVQFSDNSVFRLGKLLGYGSNTVIFELADHPGKAIRIPLYTEKNIYIQSTLDGFKDLFENGVPVVQIFSSLPGEYIVIEHIKNFVTFFDLGFEYYFTQKAKKGFESFGITQKIKISKKQRAIMEREFLLFAASTSMFQSIGDFILEQIVFDTDRQKWIFIDWHHKHILSSHQNNETFAVFEAFEKAGLVNFLPGSSIQYRPDSIFVNQEFIDFSNKVWRSLIISKNLSKGFKKNITTYCSIFL